MNNFEKEIDKLGEEDFVGKKNKAEVSSDWLKSPAAHGMKDHVK